MDKNIFYAIISLLFIFCSCTETTPPRKVSPAFYHWKNTLDLSDAEQDYCSNLKIKKLYLRFFDIDWQNHQAVPLSILNIKSSLPDSVEIIPTVFITNRSLLNIAEENIPDLAHNIFKKINQLAVSFDKHPIKEIQFDCDWSPKSQTKYFRLIKLLKEKFQAQHQKISATIRLHQIKYYQETGVPDVDRGVLMFYNMADINDPDIENSILNISIAKQYLHNFDRYPLPLDVALPIFKWGLIFQDGKMVKIINNLSETALQDSSRFLKINQNRFKITKSTYLEGHYLYRNDQIRLEQVSEQQLQVAADLLAPMITNKDLNIIFYHLDSIQIADYPYETLKDIYHRFH